ncbi:MAG: ATPase [Chloroflexi bacterium]|nr:ATPase [Chloroflexota bacterium]
MIITAVDASTRHLAARLAVVEARVRAAVARRRIDDPDPDDRFRGLYVSETQVDALLGGEPGPLLPAAPGPDAAAALGAAEAEADAAESAGEPIRLRALARAFGLDPLDVELLLVALAPDLDPRLERLYGYLHDDVSRRRASAGLALELAGAGTASGAARARLRPGGPLVRGGLLVVEDGERPFLTRALRAPDRVTAHLLGDATPDQALDGILAEAVDVDVAGADLLASAFRAGARLAYVRERVGTAAVALAARAIQSVAGPPLVVDLGRLGPADDPREIAAAALREARLRDTGLVAGPLDLVAERGTGAIRTLAEAPCPVVLHGARGWDPGWSRTVPFLMEAGLPSSAERHRVWLGALDGSAPAHVGEAIARLPFRLAPEQVVRAATAARIAAGAAGRPLELDDIAAGARAQNAAGLERLARRIAPRVGWTDLVLPVATIEQLRELAARARHLDRVLVEWGMGRTSLKGRGVTALFAGDSGTGKTMSAEVIAGALGLDLYVIDLSTVVDKYIGETEKNLDRVFTEADRVNGVLLFDEADAVFGKRSEVKDARDRYANVEVAYLLQRMELFDGMAILTTNLRANVDEAFLRRLDAIVDFPLPEVDDRRRLWARNLAAAVPLGDDIDLGFLAAAFKLSGGNIRNIAVGAAFLAAEAGRPLGMVDLVRETGREYRKLGRLCVEAEFGRYFPLVAVAAEGS